MGVVFGEKFGQIRSNVRKKNKETGIINGLFSEQEVVVIENT